MEISISEPMVQRQTDSMSKSKGEWKADFKNVAARSFSLKGGTLEFYLANESWGVGRDDETPSFPGS